MTKKSLPSKAFGILVDHKIDGTLPPKLNLFADVFAFPAKAQCGKAIPQRTRTRFVGGEFDEFKTRCVYPRRHCRGAKSHARLTSSHFIQQIDHSAVAVSCQCGAAGLRRRFVHAGNGPCAFVASPCQYFDKPGKIESAKSRKQTKVVLEVADIRFQTWRV